MGKGQCNICPVYFQIVSEFMYSIPQSQYLFEHKTAVLMNWIFTIFFPAGIVANCFSAAKAAYLRLAVKSE